MRIEMNSKAVDKKFDEAQSILDTLKEEYKQEELQEEYKKLQNTLDKMKKEGE